MLNGHRLLWFTSSDLPNPSICSLFDKVIILELIFANGQILLLSSWWDSQYLDVAQYCRLSRSWSLDLPVIVFNSSLHQSMPLWWSLHLHMNCTYEVIVCLKVSPNVVSIIYLLLWTRELRLNKPLAVTTYNGYAAWAAYRYMYRLLADKVWREGNCSAPTAVWRRDVHVATVRYTPGNLM